MGVWPWEGEDDPGLAENQAVVYSFPALHYYSSVHPTSRYDLIINISPLTFSLPILPADYGEDHDDKTTAFPVHN